MFLGTIEQLLNQLDIKDILSRLFKLLDIINQKSTNHKLPQNDQMELMNSNSSLRLAVPLPLCCVFTLHHTLRSTLTILTGLMSMLCLVCPLRNGGSSSTSSISKSSSETAAYKMNELEVQLT